MASTGRRTNGYKLLLKKCRLQITTESLAIKINHTLEQTLAETLGQRNNNSNLVLEKFMKRELSDAIPRLAENWT